MRIRRLGIVAPIAGAVLVVGGLFTQSVGFAAGSTSPVWQGGVSNFNTPAWLAAWGLKASDNVANGCKGATASYSCDWGYPGTQQTDPTTPGGNLVPVADATAPGGDGALLVKYPAPSGPPSCKCNLGGGQFYQYATVAPGLTSLATSTTMDLKYYYNMPTNFDFGGGGAWGKMPGLWGGGIPGCESGAQHCAGGWSTRYMWRGLTTGGAAGEVYWYTAAGGGFGADLGVGSWTWHADGKWHSIEQSVDIVSGQILVWQDGAQVFNMKETFPAGSFPSGIFFSTFHGGHSTSNSPKAPTQQEMADFSISASGPQTGGVVNPTPTPTQSITPTPTPTQSNPPSPTPVSGQPGPVSNVTVSSTGGGNANVQWSAGSDGGSPILVSAVWCYSPTAGASKMFEAWGSSPMNVSGLSTGQPYTCTVIPYNANGWGTSWSDYSPWITE